MNKKTIKTKTVKKNQVWYDKQVLTELQTIPGVGRSIAQDLYAIGIHSIKDLKNRNPQILYEQSNAKAGSIQDRCLLYTFRCAVYFASTKTPKPELLKWWNWQDANK